MQAAASVVEPRGYLLLQYDWPDAVFIHEKFADAFPCLPTQGQSAFMQNYWLGYVHARAHYSRFRRHQSNRAFTTKLPALAAHATRNPIYVVQSIMVAYNHTWIKQPLWIEIGVVNTGHCVSIRRYSITDPLAVEDTCTAGRVALLSANSSTVRKPAHTAPAGHHLWTAFMVAGCARSLVDPIVYRSIRANAMEAWSTKYESFLYLQLLDSDNRPWGRPRNMLRTQQDLRDTVEDTTFTNVKPVLEYLQPVMWRIINSTDIAINPDCKMPAPMPGTTLLGKLLGQRSRTSF